MHRRPAGRADAGRVSNMYTHMTCICMHVHMYTIVDVHVYIKYIFKFNLSQRYMSMKL